MREVFALLGICGAGAALTAGACGPPAAEVQGPAWVDAVAVPAGKREAIDVAPAELGDDEAVERMRHRVRLRRIGAAWLSLDAESIDDHGGGSGGRGRRLRAPAPDEDPDEEGTDELLPVIGETAGKIRVVVEEDNARVALWIDRRDAWPSIVARVKLGRVSSGAGPWLQTGTSSAERAAAGAAVRSAGVWLEPGAPIAVRRADDEERRRGSRRTGPVLVRISLRDPDVAVRGAVPAAFVGQVWIAPRGEPTVGQTDMTDSCAMRWWEPPEEQRPQGQLGEDAVIFAAPADGAPPLAVLRSALEVAVIARHGAWAEVELARQYARIRGFVRESSLSPPTDIGRGGGGCTGRGFGMSHADRIEVPAGTCLYDRANGEIAGVAIEDQVRLGSKARAGEAWSMVYVSTRWAISSVYVRDLGSDPAQPQLESCAGRRHR